MGLLNQTYKDLHESFVSLHNGTGVLEVSLASSVSAASIMFRNILHMSTIFPRKKWLYFVFDFMCLVLPSELALTICEQNITALLLVIGITALGIGIYSIGMSFKDLFSLKIITSFLQREKGESRLFLTHFRAIVNIFTAIAILAVDFKVFPRRFAKVETYGTGLMDPGVGMFILSNAAVSPEARNRHGVLGSVQKIYKSLLSCLPLILLGVARAMTVKGTDYQEHVTEYGVHWNFFFTLAAVKILSSILLCVMPHRKTGVLGLLIIMSYEYLLSGCGLKDYIVTGHDGKGGRQQGILDANREGIYSSIGYLSLYFLGIELGKYIFRKRTKMVDHVFLLLGLIAISVFGYISMQFTTVLVDPVSRRFANLSFVLWMIGQGTQMMLLYLSVDIIVDYFKHIKDIKEMVTDDRKYELQQNEDTGLCLLKAVNYNGLFFFLLSNILTGLVNLSIRTIYATTLEAFTVITGYLLILSATAVILSYKKIQLKFW